MGFRALIFYFLVFSTALAGDLKVATVDMRVLFKEYPGTGPAQKKMDALIREKKDSLADSEDLLRDLRGQLDRRLSPKERKLKQKVFEDEKQDYLGDQNRIQEELDEHEREMTQALIGQIKSVVAEVARERGYDLVLDSNDAVNTGEQPDLTGEVLQKFTHWTPTPNNLGPGAP